MALLSHLILLTILYGSLVYRRRNWGWERLRAFISIHTLAWVTPKLREAYLLSNKAIDILVLTFETGRTWLWVGREGWRVDWSCTGPGVLGDYAVTSQGFCWSPAILRHPGSPAWRAPTKNDDTGANPPWVPGNGGTQRETALEEFGRCLRSHKPHPLPWERRTRVPASPLTSHLREPIIPSRSSPACSDFKNEEERVEGKTGLRDLCFLSSTTAGFLMAIDDV